MTPARMAGSLAAAVACFAIAYAVSHGSGAAMRPRRPRVAPMHVPAATVVLPGARRTRCAALAPAPRVRHKTAKPARAPHRRRVPHRPEHRTGAERAVRRRRWRRRRRR